MMAVTLCFTWSWYSFLAYSGFEYSFCQSCVLIKPSFNGVVASQFKILFARDALPYHSFRSHFLLANSPQVGSLGILKISAETFARSLMVVFLLLAMLMDWPPISL